MTPKRSIDAANDDNRLRVRVSVRILPQVTIYRGEEIVGTAGYSRALGAVNQGPGSHLTDREWQEANSLVRSAVIPVDGREVWVSK